MINRLNGKGVCIFYLDKGLIPFTKNRFSSSELDNILEIEGVEELTYNRITKSVFIIYDNQTTKPRRIFADLKRLFPGKRYIQKEITMEKIRGKGILSRSMEKFLSKVDKRYKERIEKCRDVAFIMPVGMAVQPIKGYYKKIIARPWLQFIWHLIVL